MDDAKPANSQPQGQPANPEVVAAAASGTQTNPIAQNPLKESDIVPGEKRGLDFILDIPLRVSVELGRSKILVQDLLKLHKGSVVELNKLAGESLEVLVNERVVARGEVIVINDKFGIRLTDIVSHADRIRELGAAA